MKQDKLLDTILLFLPVIFFILLVVICKLMRYFNVFYKEM